jgi:hypothetical protein
LVAHGGVDIEGGYKHPSCTHSCLFRRTLCNRKCSCREEHPRYGCRAQ